MFQQHSSTHMDIRDVMTSDPKCYPRNGTLDQIAQIK